MLQSLVNTPKTKRGELTLEKIIRAAELTFGSKGYYHSSINDIATAAKVAPGTIYIYFSDKYTLYCYLLLQYSHEIRKHIAIRTRDCKTRLEAERMGLIAFLETIREKRYMYHIIWESLYIEKQLFVDYYEEFARKYVVGIINSQEKEELRECDPTILAYMLMGISNFIGLKYVIFEDGHDLEKIADQIIDLLHNGIFTNKQTAI